MKTWRALIVDDEKLAREELITQLSVYKQIEIIGEASDVESAYNMVLTNKPNLVFLDIDLGPYTGFDLLARIDTGYKVIFVTAHDEYAIRAFEVNALDYLLKPVWEDRLGACIKRLGDPHSDKLPEKLDSHDQILVKMRSSSRFIRVNEITCIESCADYTRIYSSKKISGLVHHTLKRWLERLPSDNFIRIHKSYLINTNFVDRIEKAVNTGIMAYLEFPDKPLPVSRRFGSRLFADYRP
jgi:two-component system LytT family response regulator